MLLAVVLASVVCAEAPHPAAYVTGSVLTIAAASVASGAAGVALYSSSVQHLGRPDPWATTAAFALTLTLDVTLTHLLLPAVAKLSGASSALDALAAHAWETSRWAALAGVAGIAVFGLGAGLEQDHFGRGQGVLLAGVVTSLVGFVVWNVIEATSVWRVGKAP
jgi:hypothetical protein